ncbi:SDR family NAD(P)-dependent oxidoreductase [Paraburkholderia silvatlantica]|uniref:NAD(P)-dependent dehydrogenase (Short-subunit alcohol dehydrogenase family) n=1 Tax=Paraburkholderia silvatlantica TaxID=321895 RepID=A0A2V4U1V7_9BURK|nr:SDR family NAD(P)-dependent oxidoreductase [Paraburkholderia silvatlantica]PYE14133.1 NAD(P)-dependent dehydrogenase (short-subunit alcohol dehydrogenase family) [Paraburkholderia silvatlantica]TDR04967.1 NAD(P)-dependent dehydrogenase (short-subunit alcohol dehydrogenase family) [Paraburkholderia silvatlantica]
MHIEGKVVVITGGASGLGLATARYLVQEKGARVAIFDLNAEAGAKAVEEVGAEHAMFVQTDVTSEESVQNAVAAVTARFGTVHVCINCAALPTPCKVLGKEGKATPLAKFAQVTAVNVNGVFNVMSKCAEQMVRNDPEAGEERGVIINISSGAAYEAQIGQVAYAASKAALLGMNMPAARELGDVGIRVNAIAPGLFMTPMVRSLDEKIVTALTTQIEAPRRLGDMREFAHCCAFIIENAYLNAHTIRLDAASRLRAR